MLCLLLSKREQILCPILALQTNLKHVYCNENKSSSKDEVLLFPQLILRRTKSKHKKRSEFFFNPGHFSIEEPELHLPNQQESGILSTGEPSTAHRPSAKELIQQEPGARLSQQLAATSHTRRRKHLQWPPHTPAELRPSILTNLSHLLSAPGYPAWLLERRCSQLHLPMCCAHWRKNNLLFSTKERCSAFRWACLHSCCKTGRSQQELTRGSTTHLQPETNLVLNTSKRELEGGLCGMGRRKMKPNTQVRVQGLPMWQVTYRGKRSLAFSVRLFSETHHYFLPNADMHF